MTVTVPATEKTGAFQLQQQITTLSARTDSASQQLLSQRQIDLVVSLIDQNRLDAVAILAGYTGSRNPLAAQIAKYQAIVNAGGGAASFAAPTLLALQRQAVVELMTNGALSAATILANQVYSGGPSR